MANENMGIDAQVYTMQGKKSDLPVSRKMAEDPFAGLYGDRILQPPYDLGFLAGLPEKSNILSQCIEAMETNIAGFGFTLEPMDWAKSGESGELSKEAEDERKTLMHFFEFCNQDIPYSQLCRRVRRDLETLGNGYWEVLRDGKGDIVWLEHIEGYTMRLTRQDDEYTPIEQYIRDEESNELKTYQTRKRFRRFVQIRNNVKVFFKEFGDPRPIDSKTGYVMGEDEVGEYTPATEVIHFKLYCPSSPYGVPRWMGNLLAVMGSRQAEEVNFEYFENNTIPPLALMVAGEISDNAVDRIKDFLQDEMRGRKGFGKMLIIKAKPFDATIPGEKVPAPSIRFEHLSDAQQKDSLFGNYDMTNREKIRSSFRLPPIFVGLTADYTRATAQESREVAEEQVFGPERADHDFVINRLLFPAMGVKYWKYKSLPPTVDNAPAMASTLAAFCQCGMTVREAREEISRLLNHPLTQLDDGETGTEGTPAWLDLPMAVYLAQLQHGGNMAGEEQAQEIEKSASDDKEALFLRALTGMEKALEEEHEHSSIHDPCGEAGGMAEDIGHPDSPVQGREDSAEEVN